MKDLNEDEVGYSVNVSPNQSRRDEICDFMDAFNDVEKFCQRTKPSTLLKGGWAAMQKGFRIQNPDWMAQSAHSFREIHYQYIDSKSNFSFLKRITIPILVRLFKYEPGDLTKGRVDRISDSLKTYVADEARRQNLAKLINKIHLAFSNISHHFKKTNSLKQTIKTLTELNISQKSTNSVEDISYEQIVDRFEGFLLDIKPRSIKSHQIIDQLISSKNLDENKVKAICFSGGSLDSRLYFFSKIDESYLAWVWEKGFLSAINSPAKDSTRYSYTLPELGYLVRVAEKSPELVGKILLSTRISEENFNPEVVDRFVWIIGQLPASQIKKILPKVLEENWVKLMSVFSRSAYEYKKAVETLLAQKDFDSLLVLAQILLAIREHGSFNPSGAFTDNDLFYFKDISESEIFEAILDNDNNRTEESLSVFTDILRKIVSLENPEKSEAFSFSEPFHLRDTDLFTLELSQVRAGHSREDIKSLLAVIKKLIEKLLTQSCGNEPEARRLYLRYINHLPDSHTLWRLKLFALTRCPEHVKDELKKALFRVFNVGEQYFEIDGGAEYHHTIVICFGVLDPIIQREYVSSLFTYYGVTLTDKDIEKRRKRDGLEILDYISNHLTDDEKLRAKIIFGKVPVAGRHVPHASIEMGRGGVVQPKSHVSPADFSIEEIISHLKSDWRPETLNAQFEHDDFLSPRGAEGLGDALKLDFRARMDAYFAFLSEFFDRDTIHSCYLYSLLREIDEMLRNRQTLTDEQNSALLTLFELVRVSGEQKTFERVGDRSWLADWITVHKITADILLGILTATGDSLWFKNNREEILKLIGYLLSIESSPSPEEDDPKFGGPYHVAINSVRGQAYIAFAQFACNDGKVLAPDVKKLFEKILSSDSSNPVRFLIGHHLGIFYFRDKSYIQKLLPNIFPNADITKEKLFFASWEGYLANKLYGELFVTLRDYYQYAIALNPDSYPDREYFKGLDETLAAHLALEYSHFDFSINDLLFTLFWSTPNDTRQYEFVSFIGRSCLTRDQAGDKWLEDNHVSKEKLMKFWDWLLSTDLPITPKAFSGFGFWINPDKEIIDEKFLVKNLAASLEKSKGALDWDYGLMQRIRVFAEIDPVNTLGVIRNLLLLDGELNPNRRAYFGADNEIKEALSIIYKVSPLKPKVEELISTLIEKGSSMFWSLKDVLTLGGGTTGKY